VRRRLETHPDSVLEVYVAAHRSPRVEAVIRLVPPRVPVRPVADTELSRLTGSTSHQGIAARTLGFQYQDFAAVPVHAADLLLVVDQMQDPQNFGALLRSAAAARVAAVIIPRDGAVGVTPAVEKAAAGAVNDVAVCQVVNLRRTLETLRQNGFWSVGLVPRGGHNAFATDFPRRVVVVLGGEGGLRPLIAAGCDFRVSIPMADGIESLNASVAGAVMLFELRRRLLLDR
jgi:23S rRNA (guanosine2251-2'-O)-methyltransferase